jgi:hypothetical protein
MCGVFMPPFSGCPELLGDPKLEVRLQSRRFSKPPYPPGREWPFTQVISGDRPSKWVINSRMVEARGCPGPAPECDGALRDRMYYHEPEA